MYRIALIINEIYNKILPLAEQKRVQLNLDLGDGSTTIAFEPAEIQKALEEHLHSTVQRSAAGEISVSLKKHHIIITDSGTTLSPTVCHLLSQGRVQVKSRVGFGTEVSIDLQAKDTTDKIGPEHIPTADIPQATAKSSAKAKPTQQK